MAANRTKTIEVMLPMLSTAAAYQTEGTSYLDSGDTTIFIPETTSRTFQSVSLEVVVHDNHATIGADLSAFSVRGSCNSGSNWTTRTRASGYTDSGENMHHIFIVDMTAEFTARFTGKSDTFRWGMYLDYSAAGPTWANGSAKLLITYSYDDTEVLDTGTAESGGATTLTDSDKSWTTDAYTNDYVIITGGTGSGQSRKIASNTATELTVTSAWTTNPGSDSTYTIALARVKTVRIPIESFNGRLTNSTQEIKQTSTATNQLPALTHASTPFLPESGVTIRQAFCEIWTSTIPSTTTDASLFLRIDSGGSDTEFGLVENGNSTPISLRVLYDVTSVDWTSAHGLFARHNVTSQFYFAHPGGWLTVTYEYNHFSSTTILNSLVMGIGEDTLNVRTLGDNSVYSVERFIQEPSTVTLVQSGVWITAQTSTTSGTFSFSMGSQTATGYTPTSGATCAHMLSIVQRIDANSHRGVGVALARGLNTFTAQWYASANDIVGNVSAMMILNYTSGKHTSGDGAHAHSVHYLMRDTTTAAATGNVVFTPTYIPAIIETNYWLMSCMPIVYATGITGSIAYYVLQAERESAAGSGWADIFVTQTVGGNERLSTISNAVARFAFKRWPNDTDTSRMDIETSRSWRWYGTSNILGVAMWITYHSQTVTLSGTVSGYSGDGSGLTVTLHRQDTGEQIGTATTTTGGAYTFTWYDDTITKFAACRQDGTRVGRSDDGTA